MIIRITPAIRFVLIFFFVLIEFLVIFVLNQLIHDKELGVKEVMILAAFACGAFLFPILTRATLFIGDKYVEHSTGMPGMKKFVIRAVDVEGIYRSAVPFMGRVDYIRIKGGKEMHTILTDSMEKRREIPELLEKALHTKIIE